MLTIDEFEKIINAYPVQSSYSHFSKKVTPPYLVWMNDYTNNFNADNSVYKVIKGITIELYSRIETMKECEKLEKYLTENKILWDKSNETWIDEDKVNMSVYSIYG